MASTRNDFACSSCAKARLAVRSAGTTAAARHVAMRMIEPFYGTFSWITSVAPIRGGPDSFHHTRRFATFPQEDAQPEPSGSVPPRLPSFQCGVTIDGVTMATMPLQSQCLYNRAITTIGEVAPWIPTDATS